MHRYENEGTNILFTVHCSGELPVEGTGVNQMRNWESEQQNSYSRRSSKEKHRDALMRPVALNKIVLRDKNKVALCKIALKFFKFA